MYKGHEYELSLYNIQVYFLLFIIYYFTPPPFFFFFFGLKFGIWVM